MTDFDAPCGCCTKKPPLRMDMVDMTLKERLVSEAKENLEKDLELEEGQELAAYVIRPAQLDQIILHTIEQTIKEGCEVVEGKRIPEMVAVSEADALNIEGFNKALTDTQHALRGIIK